MMKKLFSSLVVIMLIVTVAFSFAGCGTTNNNTSNTNTSTTTQQTTTTSENTTNTTALTPQEKEELLYMAEEEKLARDVYTKLYDIWKDEVFLNISKAEQTHMDQVRSLIEKYGLEDPTADMKPGEFKNPDLQKLYNDLVARGRESLVEALKVGALIEEVDIIDLDKAIEGTDKADIKQVYENIRSGSYNHLRAFVSALEKQGITYSPQKLSPERYNEIISGSQGHGKGNGGN